MRHVLSNIHMITSSNRNIFHCTGFLSGIQWSPVDFPHKGQWRGALNIFYLRLNIWLNKQLRSWWFVTPARSLCHQRNVLFLMASSSSWYTKLPTLCWYSSSETTMIFTCIYVVISPHLLLALLLLQQFPILTGDVSIQDMQPAATLASTNQCLCDFHTALLPDWNNKLSPGSNLTLWRNTVK